MSYKKARYVLVGLEIFTGAMAIYGAISLLIDAQGFGVREEWLRGSPFTNYQIPALALLVCVGGGNLLSAALVWVRSVLGLLLSMAVGVGLMGFEIIETYSFGLRNVQQPLMFVIGLAVAILAAWMWREGGAAGLRKPRFTYAH
jgi:hypothetical protein